MKHIIAAVACIVLAAASFSVVAGQDEAQRQMTQRLQEQKLKLAAAGKAQGAECDKLMREHMKVMQETMSKMQTMKPRDGMTPKEQQEWVDERQKLMEQMMDQMITEHRLI